MITAEKLERQLRVNHRQKKQGRKASLVRGTTDTIARTLHRTPVEVMRLTRVVNSASIVNARKNRDESLDLSPGAETQFRSPGSNKKIQRVGKRKFSMKALRAAIVKVEKDVDKVPIFEHFVRRAYHDDTVLKALMSKLMPDLKSVDARVTQVSPFRLIIDLGDRPQLGPLDQEEDEDEDL